MNRRILQRLFSRAKIKPFSAWQIELTTRCPLKCRMCIREGIKDWYNADMKIEDFKKLIPYFKDVETIVLEGWGESLLHKNLIDAVRLVKAEGSQVGFVTSGKGLDKNYISELIDANVDFIGFSFAGATSRTHNYIRVNSDLHDLIGHIQTLNEIKMNKKTKNPRIHIVYLMLRDNIFEVPALLDLAKKVGIKEVVLTNLIHVTNQWQEGQRVFKCNRIHGVERSSDQVNSYSDPRILESLNPFEKILKEVEVKAKELKIKLRRPSLSPNEVAVCEENPLRNLYISVDGEVSPCVYLNPSVPSPFKRIFCGDEYQIEKVSFGNIFRETFPDIGNNRKYSEFRDSFIKRKRKIEEMYSYFSDMEQIKRFEMTPLPDPPEGCRRCHKMLGL